MHYISFILVFAIFFTNEYLFINAKELKNSKTNFNFISVDDLNHIEYTYDENGKSHKVIENINEDLTLITTKIYEKESNNQYILISEFTTEVNIKENNIEVNTIKDGNITTEIIPANKILIDSQFNDIENNNQFKID